MIMSASSLEIREMPVEQLQPAPYNPRLELKPGSKAYRKLEASLREFGLVEPLIWNELTGHVVGGHTRLRILKAMGIQTVPVSIVRLTPAREKALNVVLNNQEAQGRFDPALLYDLLEDLKDQPELELTGFSESDLRTLNLEPVPDLPPIEKKNEVEVTIVADAGTYDRFCGPLDELVARFDLTCHIRRR
jgi:ParB-like chromosome segregation protein Spo0J